VWLFLRERSPRPNGDRRAGRGDSSEEGENGMLVWTTMVLIGAGMMLALHGMLAVAASQSRHEEEAARQFSRSSRKSA